MIESAEEFPLATDFETIKRFWGSPIEIAEGIVEYIAIVGHPSCFSLQFDLLEVK